MNTVMTGQH